MKEIKFPLIKTWYICWTNDRQILTVYGYVMPDRVFTTYWDVLDTYTNEDDWKKVLLENGKTLEEIEI
tara:strand:+ start:161 stop:364 length:204 start_codon:yes stop_codon:yes gene_type:complete